MAQLASPPLNAISEVAFAAELETALEDVAGNPDSYRHSLRRLASRIRQEAGSAAALGDLVSPPSGYFLEGKTLWSGFPPCEDGLVRWAGGEQAAAKWVAERGGGASKGFATPPPPGGSGNPQDAHPSLSPLTLWATPGQLPPGGSDELRSVYALVWGELAASVLRPARLRMTTLVFQVEGLGSYELALEMAETIEEGYSSAEPGLRADLLRPHVSPAELRRLREGAPLLAHVHGEPTHEDLPRPTPDGLLSAMVRLRLGRPSTYGEHLRAFLG